MKFLTEHVAPTLRITHRTRRQTVTQSGIMQLTESTLVLELTIPSFVTGLQQTWRNVKQRFNRAMRDIFVPNIAHYAACA